MMQQTKSGSDPMLGKPSGSFKAVRLYPTETGSLEWAQAIHIFLKVTLSIGCL